MAGSPSDHLANERTFLAWTRTSISIIVFGFVVAKFGITLRQLLRVAGRGAEASRASLWLGIGFIGVGVTLALLSWLRYRRTQRQLDGHEFVPAGPLIAVVGWITAGLGVSLAVYLLISSARI